ncbi:hypothetical protein ATO7_12118 [Oceanococcus atlanticus]|uniref:Uncharacterized protein n=2 Tax=Oceanococcus atlanticus TaxID=1317117 RepID=A0A1Y1SBN2_9GAMM|nr:hypothetical protein ATO7_12118 [Oceanococcus atlanticus]
MAEDAALAETKIARALGMSFRTWRRIVREDADAKALWAEALAIERDAVLGRMYQYAIEGDVQAAKFMLAARHGLREQGAGGEDGRSSVTINLPGALTSKQYERLIQPADPLELEAPDHE